MFVRNAGAGTATLLEQPAVLAPRIVGVGTTVPQTTYTQQEVLDEFNITDPRVRSVFLNSAIERRGLTLPPLNDDGTRAIETQGELLRKHVSSGLAMGREAVQRCLKDANAELADVRYLCCVTSTGFVTPGSTSATVYSFALSRSS